MTASPDCANIIQNRSYLGAIKQYPLFHGKAKSYLFQHLNLLKSFLEMICYKVNYIPNFLSNSFCRAEAKPRHILKNENCSINNFYSFIPPWVQTKLQFLKASRRFVSSASAEDTEVTKSRLRGIKGKYRYRNCFIYSYCKNASSKKVWSRSLPKNV